MEDHQTLESFLSEESLKRCIQALTEAAEEISSLLRKGAGLLGLSSVNTFGDQQLQIDVLADQVIEKALQKSGVVESICSEERSKERPCGGTGFAVAYDPLDGSSIIDTNFAVGTIFGILKGGSFIGHRGREWTAAGCFVYGPRTELTLAVADEEYAHQFICIPQDSKDATVLGRWKRNRVFKTIESGKLFAPGNLRSTVDNSGYQKLVNYWMSNKYQLRYTGGMVPDVNQLLIKGKGVFCNPASISSPAKLRLLFECIPLAFLIEKAGGRSSNGNISLLDIPVNETEERCQVCYGAKEEVERFDAMVGQMFI
ncbi:Sedoheptulose-1,7-bisphosphatase, chloroplastic [Galdieria sulphuraria]|uniref:Sedoheptulose-1,7-bisphosphatase, chloroplast n=1 Tax=Galdieria sulphuraria TaxID=130081 RepID=M2XRI3_GALSU|nr:sedoheptulose-1,7-bisphosphatase, chloroplast [Galdieria sulphuraria]EME26278.1 sedoheptulose-1,7-bisphosphatase, chloroplast [Galdieria sulphuraria]GJD08693.1 Sedoheptulose-1,7-bisphosphatase, chloroplastic [Galdieria sulphuraria]|eukprot:XP_005702798.1 sedoheptulose-1,7-bisphosphatase, chloroplast [Galdieria sulphuraria]